VCRQCRFFAEIFLAMFVDKVAPELLLLDCAAEPSIAAGGPAPHQQRSE